MPQIVNTNVASLNAQRNLNRSQDMLSTSLERISSGLRVNSARDDAAGLAISNRLSAQVRGFNQAARNAADAISLAQTGEGSLAEVTNNLQRMREIAVQSRNATNTIADRQSLDAEFQQLLAENDRIAQTTVFNGRNVLDGTLGSAVFQVGANVGETVSVDLGASTSMRTDVIGKHASVTYKLGFTDGTTAADALLHDNNADIDINTVSIDASVNGANGLTNGSAQAIANAINAKRDGVGGHGVTATAGTTSVTVTAAEIAARSSIADPGGNMTLLYTVSMNGTQVFQQGEADAALTVTQLTAAFNTVSSTTGVVATENSDGSMTLNTSDGRNIILQEVLSGSTDTDAGDTATGYFGHAQLTGAGASDERISTFKADLTLSANKAIVLAVDNNSANIFGSATGGTGPANNASATTATTGLSTSDVLNITNADSAINRVDQALSDVDGLRGTFGAVQSRFESTIRNLQTAAENASAANSRIMDADFAEETAALTRAQILQQAGVSILAQANALPQNALALLQ